MSEKKSSRGSTSVSKSVRQQQSQHLFIPDEHMLLVYHAELSKDYLMLCLKDSIVIFHTTKRSIYREHRVKSQCAAIVPNTNYIVYANANSVDLRSSLHVWDYEKDSIESRLTFSFDIVTLKASHRCLIFASLTSLYVFTFPPQSPSSTTQQATASTLSTISAKKGLTIVHSTETKGEVFIRNFTNRETNKFIAEIRSTDHRVSERIRRISSKRIQDMEEEEEDVKSEIQVKAHHQHVSIVRLSPNGFRFVSGSTKGTVLRLFSCLNGELISQFYVCAALSNIVDIHFIAQGNAVVCLNDQNHIKLFHTKMSEQELICQSLRRGKEVYEQENPRSWLSFLGFLNEELRYERPFSYFNLETLSTNKDIKLAQPKIIPSQLAMSEIKEESLEKESFLEQHNQNESANSQSIQKEKSEEIEISELVNPIINSNDRSNSIRQAQLQQARITRNSNSRKRKNATSLKSLVKRQSEVTMMVREADMNFRGIIMFQNHINIRAFKGKYYYELKYDPFNGGEMMIKQGKYNVLEALRHQ